MRNVPYVVKIIFTKSVLKTVKENVLFVGYSLLSDTTTGLKKKYAYHT